MVNSYKIKEMLINKKNINKLFYTFISIHLIFWTLVPSFTNENLPLDTIEALAWGGNLDWGFNKHPPASAFFAQIFFRLFANQDWAYYLLSQIFITFSFLTIFKFSQEFFKDKTFGFISVLILEGIYFYNYTTPEFNVYISQLPFWTLTVYYSYKAFLKDHFKDWALFGFFGAIGFLSHYLFSYLLLSIALFFVFSFWKSNKFNFKSLIALEVFIIIMIPHLIWLTENDYITITYGLHRTGSGMNDKDLIDHIIYPFSFLSKQIGILIPFWIMLYTLIDKFKMRLNFKDKKFLFLFFINFAPIILITLTSLLTGSNIKTMWLTPFYLYFGIFFIYLFKRYINLKNLKSFFISFLFFFVLSPIIYSTVSITQTDKRTDYPGKKIAEKIQYVWNQDHKENINVVLGDEWRAGNLSYHLKSRPVWEGFITKNKLNSLTKFSCIDNVCVGYR
jgi:4-amino-4-deoxy-L-arabinose transferase-like glycosyltransferase